jgi:tRNA threonylcarbamoyladenosine biosynthesis protein TsaE
MTAGKLTLETHSPEATEKLGRVLSGLIPTGSLVALRGELGSGKTCLVRGMAARFATDDLVSSPTFTLVNQYGDSPRLYHVDLYRVNRVEELADIGYEDLFDPDGVCVVEWAERADPLLPSRRLDVLLEHVNETTRRITLVNEGVLPARWIEVVQETLPPS